MNPEKLLAKTRNNPRDVRFSDFVRLAEAFGYRFDRQDGSHRVFVHPTAPVVLNIQPEGHGKAKEYQVRQFLRDIDRYGLTLEDAR